MEGESIYDKTHSSKAENLSWLEINVDPQKKAAHNFGLKRKQKIKECDEERTRGIPQIM